MRLSSLTIAGLISVSVLAAADAAAKPRAPVESAANASVSAADHMYKSLLAQAIRRHTPRRATIGRGGAFCKFLVGKSGGITIIAASGSSPAHATLARRIIESLRAPPPPNGAFVASQSFHFN
jgi:protein TonB